MKRLYHSLMLLIAGATQKELARHVRYLKVENQILRSKLASRIVVTPKERQRLIRFAAMLGGALDCLATIVHPDTIRRWIREQRKSGKKRPRQGRPPTKEEIKALILKLASENNGWGYTRIIGELRKLGIKPPSRNTIKRILLAGGFDGSGNFDWRILGEMGNLAARRVSDAVNSYLRRSPCRVRNPSKCRRSNSSSR